MLDVDCGLDVDVGIQQFYYILLVLFMVVVWCIVVGQFIYQYQCRMLCQYGIQVYFLQDMVVIGYVFQWQLWQVFQQGLGIGVFMGFYQVYYQVDVVVQLFLCMGQYGVGFVYVWCCIEEYGQFVVGFVLQVFNQGIGLVGMCISYGGCCYGYYCVCSGYSLVLWCFGCMVQCEVQCYYVYLWLVEQVLLVFFGMCLYQCLYVFYWQVMGMCYVYYLQLCCCW